MRFLSLSCLSMLFVMASFPVLTDEVSDKVWKEERFNDIRSLVEQKKYDEAYTKLESMKIKSARVTKSHKEDLQLTSLMVEILLHQKKYKEAVSKLEVFSPKLNVKEEEKYFAILLQLGNVYLSQKNYVKANALFSKLIIREGERPINKIYAAECLGLSYMGAGEYKKAIRAFLFSQEIIKKYVISSKGINSTNIKQLSLRLEKNIELANEKKQSLAMKNSVVLAEEAFRLYEIAEDERRQGKHEEAIAHFSKVINMFPNILYAKVSKLKICQSLVDSGNYAEAKKQLLQSMDTSPVYDLYSGEVIFLLGRIALDNADLAEAMKWFAILDNWIKNVRKNDPLQKQFAQYGAFPGMKPLILKKKQATASSCLVNRITAPWYLNDLESRCAKHLGFLNFIDENKEAASKQYKRILELDKLVEAPDAGVFEVYKSEDFKNLTAGLARGAFYASNQDLTYYRTKKQIMAVLLGGFYYATKHYKKSEMIARRLLNNEYGTLNKAQQDYPQLLYASNVYWLRGQKKAYEEYLRVFDVLQGTPSELRAQYLAAKVAVDSKDQALRKEGVELWQELVVTNNEGNYVSQAWLGLALVYSESEKTMDKCLSILKNFPSFDKELKKTSQQYLAEFEGKLALKNNK